MLSLLDISNKKTSHKTIYSNTTSSSANNHKMTKCVEYHTIPQHSISDTTFLSDINITPIMNNYSHKLFNNHKSLPHVNPSTPSLKIQTIKEPTSCIHSNPIIFQEINDINTKNNDIVLNNIQSVIYSELSEENHEEIPYNNEEDCNVDQELQDNLAEIIPLQISNITICCITKDDAIIICK
ncbi:hypothetical protein HL033_01995 [Neoehrlichia mikurensis]|uniref:Uncharacterized protein n=1 Tax=Neoehrlichia mikurensis TaxID=89586 RepID=A0A9Q9C0I0_9RICK|nr:hypothetical protein [Neoehrlichia mikurensis]QXK92303.1 hypothetical protein IAH97_01990 [Neoehrlichia mikurensis]QXK92757.1 hypothetical protein HUN61_01985 [Neoehrlichia mikurensis]QXK93998.1 hypothetical protein HL033_01995 [Neoehrlichia mikurensis]UTO55839.1 hypothetical protein LUA82_02120 [Neoehrlichia mikurensis]UTO56754.1 hypothetical protein LUA81_02100 [Neoehrlichia mikurensis]